MDKEKIKKEVLEFLKSKVVAVIATVSPDDTPEAATIHYVVDDDLNFYFMSETNSRKVQNIATNNKVALVVGTEDIPVTVQIQGEVSPIDNGEELMQRFHQLAEASNQGNYKPLLEGLKGRPGGSFYKVKPTWLQWTDFRESSNEMRNPIVLIP